MKAIITEKRSVALAIAKVLGASEDRKDYLAGNGYAVTWCQGHLLEIDAGDAAAGKWTLDNLPIIPEEFGLTPRKDASGSSIRHRLDVIGSLFSRCDSIVCCTDAGREGQLIFDEVYRYLGCVKPVERLWVSSLTPEAIRQGFAELYDNADPRFANLTKAARCRSEADWIVGINGTRALTLSAGSRQTVLTVGRVQTPTLCMICDRFVEHMNFKPVPYWYIEGESAKDGQVFKWRTDGRYFSEDECAEDFRTVSSAGFLTVREVDTERKTERPPLLYDLTSLQKAADSRFGYTADETLDAAQALYEKQLLSYPRTGSRYISEDVFVTIPHLMSTLESDPKLGAYASRLKGTALSRRSVNDTKLTDHHALIITGKPLPADMPEREFQIWMLVATRFVESFSPDNIADITKVTLEANGVKVYAKGRKDVILGWRAINREAPAEEEVSRESIDEEDITMQPLPEMREGEIVTITDTRKVQSETKPKPLYTTATLLSAMQTAGSRVDDRSAAAALRDVGGLGTSATRADILKTLVDRKYVERKSKKFVPTELGFGIYKAVRDRDIANVDMTARWELSLNGIAEGTVDDRLFNERIRNYSRKLTNDLTDAQHAAAIKERLGLFEVLCPRCGTPMRMGDKSAWCPECKLAVWREQFGRRLPDATLKKLITEKQTGVIKGLKGKSGKTFDARLTLDKDYKIKLEFPNKK